MTSRTPMVYLVDDDASMCLSVSRLLRIEGFQCLSFSSAEEFLAQNLFKRPACVILDFRLPGINGLDLQSLMHNRNIHIPIVFITGHGKIPISVEAMKKGAIDFLPKPFSSDSLIQAVNLGIDKDRKSLQLHRRFAHAKKAVDLLSKRERQVLQGVMAGLLNKQIAIKMGITDKTVKVHRSRVMEKMKATSVAHLIRLAQTAGISSSSISSQH